MVSNESFSIATLIYARLRRVSGRVVDALYLAENIHYARHVVALCEATQDDELFQLVQRLKRVLDLNEVIEEAVPEPLESVEALPTSEPTEDDIYRSQVSHHYIGALR